MGAPAFEFDERFGGVAKLSKREILRANQARLCIGASHQDGVSDIDAYPIA
jgi:hypothetical protein